MNTTVWSQRRLFCFHWKNQLGSTLKCCYLTKKIAIYQSCWVSKTILYFSTLNSVIWVVKHEWNPGKINWTSLLFGRSFISTNTEHLFCRSVSFILLCFWVLTMSLSLSCFHSTKVLFVLAKIDQKLSPSNCDQVGCYGISFLCFMEPFVVSKTVWLAPCD